ncbi:hypothetical protein VTK26DRAFT_4334 [Humicola hyalothermophila]
MNEGESNPELESFRAQWRAEVQAKHASGSSQQQQQQQQQRQHRTATGQSASAARARYPGAPRGNPPTSTKKPVAPDDDDDYVQSQVFDEAPSAALAGPSRSGGHPSTAQNAEPVSALEHYEKAVEREAAGNLGESLRLYRKAFRMDDSVDQKYRNKYFPKPPPKPAHSTSVSDGRPGAGFTSTATQAGELQSMEDLITSFSVLSIEPAPPEVEGMPPPPCPIATLPEEILVHILRDVAILDVGDFVRLSRVCKRFAYLVATEDRIWRRICLGSEFGFGGMHYYWQRKVSWGPLTENDLLREANETEEPSELTDSDVEAGPLTLQDRARRHAQESTANTLALHRSLYGGSWQRMFRQRPRIRFNGCYISTINYIRAGQASSNQITWNSPVHIVTYYRYLRFFRDGTVISLMTTSEPADVVHHVTREALELHAGKAAGHLPSAVMQDALRGRWRLARKDEEGETDSGAEGDLVIETEGVSHYIYRLDLALRTAGRPKGPRSNKLVWRGFYSYNPLTRDWADFTTRNTKPYYFSRVKSYGVMGA